ncbi:uncharacterized protein CC84DRAFT_1205979 [Paraphaeosphaeria sporulosa]|uniref:Uncharacterized protein n=1 Tax=Paraphaeosphaeria sporulosa TaxID=1460663 RepID=A0A177CFX1_9PLEO|nr:uncharacterized protein CC84DRAFT_1205979 [Paraphaeosphaeria sporulosa]OAG06503.1 hypothetical protein CC84DRAFT_1205979 [Paraphaeosphaeria sporulosa]
MATNFTFVHVSDPATNPKPEESQQIRSRCMQGKNNREDSHRSIRERKRREKQAMEDMQVVQTSMRPPTPMLSADTLISDLSLVRFAGPDIDAEAKGILAYNLVNHSVFALDRAVDFCMLEHASFTFLFHDPAFLDSILTASNAASDLRPTWDGKPSPKTLLHLRTTLHLLREKMSAKPSVHEDESILVVINLALLSAIIGDWPAAASHLYDTPRYEVAMSTTYTSHPAPPFRLE